MSLFLRPEDVPILYQDDALVVVNKPDGVVIHHGLPQEDIALVDLVRAQVDGPIYPTHRLDRATSGVIVFARHQEAAAAINGAFAARDVEKYYLALVSKGIAATGEIDLPLSRKARQHRKSKQAALLPSLTTFERLAEAGDAALLQLTPHTGRQHQLRRHLQAIKAPIWGDKRYGHKRHNRDMRIALRLHRMALHAYRLVLPHPHGEMMEWIAPLPPGLWKPMAQLGFDLDALGLVIAS